MEGISLMKYRKKPIVIDAFKWTGDADQLEDPEWIVEKIRSGEITVHTGNDLARKRGGMKNWKDPYILIPTLEGTMEAQVGDYIIKGVKGEIYPCKPDIFEATYELVGE
jgi:hypothetical protein